MINWREEFDCTRKQNESLVIIPGQVKCRFTYLKDERLKRLTLGKADIKLE